MRYCERYEIKKSNEADNKKPWRVIRYIPQEGGSYLIIDKVAHFETKEEAEAYKEAKERKGKA